MSPRKALALPFLVVALALGGPSAWAQNLTQPQSQTQTQNPSPAPAPTTTPSSAATPAAAASSKTYEFDVAGNKQWMDTNLDLRAGEKLRITGSGSVTYPAGKSSKSRAQSFGPEGLARSFADLIHQYPVSDGGHGALIGRLGSGEAAQAFLFGESKEFESPVGGRLFLGLNQSSKDAGGAEGSFHVKIEVLDAGVATSGGTVAGGPPETPVPSITSSLLEKIPRRVNDPQGNAGDMVNVLIVGTQDEVVQVFQTAGWVQVDRSVQETVLTGLMNTLEKKDYLTMPMSTLYLFERPQDYGFAHAEPVRVVMSRNHLRAWKSPYEADGRPVWCIAATHDIGFERDQRNNSITHKIDPAIDGEREYVNDTLSGTGLVTARTHVTPKSPLKEAKTATGGSFHSDGRILVLVLKPSGSSATKQ